ncbi:MAG: hypothetical protein U1F33_16420 [Alphaproteobacteria bacterium]
MTNSENKAMLLLTAEGTRIEIALDVASAPKTLNDLLATLPARIDLHCAKIAGDQILWPTPILQPLESARDIHGTPPGAFIYYPKRQFLEIMYGPLQEETASVTLLGQVKGDLEPVRRLGERVQAEHGWRTIWAELAPGPASGWRQALAAAAGTPRRAPPADAAREEARRARVAMWQAPPQEIERLRARRGVMLPFGPLVFAESETRKLHENLWLLRETGDARLIAESGSLLIRGAAVQLRDFLGLAESAGALAGIADALPRTKEPGAFLDEAILLVGRLSHWLDLYFPWQKLNALAEAAASGTRGA